MAREVGQLLRATREGRGLSQARLAARAGISQQRLSKLEQGAVDPRLGELDRLFAGMGRRLRVDAVRRDPRNDPDLQFDLAEDERDAMVDSFCHTLRKLGDLPCLVSGRLAAFAHGLPVRVHRLDLLVAEPDRPALYRGIRNLNALRWSDRWQEFCDYSRPEQPGAMRWQLATGAELWVEILPELPPGVTVQLGQRHLAVPRLDWLQAADSDVARLISRLPAAEAGGRGGG